MSRFELVFLPPERQMNGRVSMTGLKHYQACPRAGYLYALHKGAAQSAPMVRGSAFHLAVERAIDAMIVQGEPMIPWDLMKTIVNEVLAELPVPFDEHDKIREMAWRWAEEFTIDPLAVIAVETLLVLDLGGWQVRCKVDLAEARALGQIVAVKDWKTSLSAPGFEEIARRRPDGSLAAKNFQLILYALALAFGRPVNETVGVDGERVETVEPFPLAGAAELFELELVFPALKNSEGLMVRRPMTLTRLELGEYRESLIGLLERLAESEATGDWPAVLGDGCSECPARQACPIPLELHDHAGLINSIEDAREAAEVLDRRKDQMAALQRELKAWAKAHDVEIRYGRDRALRFVYGESERIERKEEMFDAIDAAVEYGRPFDRTEWVRTVGSTSFKSVKLTSDELDQEDADGGE